MADLKKRDLLEALAKMDGAAERLIEDIRLRDQTHPGTVQLDAARHWPEAIRLAVDEIRKAQGDPTDEELVVRARRIAADLSDAEPSWQVRSWREVERKETGERVFEVLLLGVDLPEEEELLILAKPRGSVEAAPSDFCECAHTRGSHQSDGHGACDLCDCSRFRLLGPGMTKLHVEELPPPPSPDLPERPALKFLERLAFEANIELDAGTFMALQRVISEGWRVTPPDDAS